MKDDPGVVFGDVNLREAPIRKAEDGTDMGVGAGGWPTLRYFNKETGVGGAVVAKNTPQKICDEFKDGARMIEATKESMKICYAASGEGCDADEVAFFDTWRGKGAGAHGEEIARLETLLSEKEQKRMTQQAKLLKKLIAAEAEGAGSGEL